MMDPRQIASQLVGDIEWETEVSGLCRCPGEALHTKRDGKRSCRICVDGAPTIFCFHHHCEGAVAAANLRLRRALGEGGEEWALRLPGGKVLRSSDAPVVISTFAGAKPTFAHGESTFAAAEPGVLAAVTTAAEAFKPRLFAEFQWTFAQILADSPLLVADRDGEDQFRTWLRLWPADACVWIGDVYDSGKPEHATHFRTVEEWEQIGPVMGNYTCGSAFKPGSFRRSNENLNGHRFLVVESDTLAKDDVGAVFAYLRRRLHYRLHCIIDTAGKSLHAWFDAPRNKVLENRLKAGLVAFGCDPKVFTYSQPVRVPGAYREGKLQRLVWLED